VALVLAPFGLKIIESELLLLSFVIGGLSVFAFWTFFSALKYNEASRVVPVVGGIQPVIIFFIAKIFLGEQLSVLQIAAIICLIAGGILISYAKKKGKASKKWLVLAIVSGTLFALYYSIGKYIFNNTDFINGFIWPRIGTFLAALIILYKKGYIKELITAPKQAGGKSSILFFTGQASGAMFFVLVNYAIFLGSVTLVNALQGVQYVFVLILSILVVSIWPKALKEKIERKTLLIKVVAILLIFVGLFFLGV